MIVFLNVRRTPLEQRAAFFAAHRLGHEVVLIADKAPADLPERLVREVHQLDTFDAAALDATMADIAARNTVAGVVTWSDPGVEAVSRLAARHGLRAPSPAAATVARDKFRMRESLKDRPDLIPRYARVRTWDEAAKAAAEIGYPLILKPVTGNGSKGIYTVHGEDGLRPAFEELHRYVQPSVDRLFTGHDGEILVEEFLTGTEHSVEGWVQGGEVYFAGVTDKTTTPDFHLETGHVFPSALPAEALESVHALTRAVVAAFGIDDCAFHLECMVGPDGRARLVECAARGGGDFITSHLTGLATGVPFCENTLRVATGRAPLPAEGPARYAGLIRVMADRAGILEGIDGLGDALRVAGVEHIAVEREPGQKVAVPPADFVSSAVLAVIATGDSYDAVRASLAAAQQAITIRIGDER
ncbi:dehydrogenase [Streptomyces griseochromogenes]|uniref:Dehydrogenase n=1 Tax=Streptomyces griseochromogenes TaxID=68214 RepID=A0A1B1BE85_9ACTN|nr:dehydrogenase [Streptomyces griseochromogenes]